MTRAFPAKPLVEQRATTLEIVAQALECGDILAGSFSEGEFVLWARQKSEAAVRIAEAVRMAPRPLELADNVWLAGPLLGYEVKADGPPGS